MKGTLFSADFVKETNGNFRLLEINTDTGFVNAALPQFDLAAFETVLSANNITKVHVVYKNFQNNFVDYLEQYLTDNASYITTFDRTEENINTVYPSSPADAADTFILRLAYDESALLDSEYAKGTLNLFKLFTDNNADTNVVEYAYNSTDFSNDNLPRIFNGTNEPDLVVKSIGDGPNKAVGFYKLGQSSKTDAERYTDALAELGTADKVVQRFYSAGNGTHSTSYRSFKIVYGTNLDLIDLATYNAKAILDRPTSINNDDTAVSTKTDNKHYFELATNFPIFNQHGIFETERLLDDNGVSVLLASASIGSDYKSFHIEGTPDTDDMVELYAWSISGAQFPSGSYETTSTLHHLIESDLDHNLISKITLSNSAGDEFRLAPSTAVLVHDTVANEMRYVKVRAVDPNVHNFVQLDGTLVGITSNEIEVLESSNHKVYTPNLETTDNFILDGVDIQGFNIITHNFYTGDGDDTCFAAGTEITLANGDVKNIEDIVEGDEVLTYCYCDETECEKEFKAGVVTAIDHRHTVGSHTDACKSLGDEASLYTINNTEIAFTPEHPFLTKEGFKSLVPDSNQAPYNGEQEAKVLAIGDEILTENGDYIKVETIEVLRSDAEEKVYNFTVADTHTYIANGLVVHNK